MIPSICFAMRKTIVVSSTPSDWDGCKIGEVVGLEIEKCAVDKKLLTSLSAFACDLWNCEIRGQHKHPVFIC